MEQSWGTLDGWVKGRRGEEGVVADQMKAESAVADRVRRSLRSHRQVLVLVVMVSLSIW